eukprot:3582455-Pleurochrysis_carterae.AAC.1
MLRNCKRQQPAGSPASSCAGRAARRHPAGLNSDQAGTRVGSPPLATGQLLKLFAAVITCLPTDQLCTTSPTLTPLVVMISGPLVVAKFTSKPTVPQKFASTLPCDKAPQLHRSCRGGSVACPQLNLEATPL